ncbi:UNVERIFIED_ORG: hypothetical protein M2312_001989 [Rhizobium esperanzae]|nr:hypothetical protein [Rhizobium esperanzae]
MDFRIAEPIGRLRRLVSDLERLEAGDIFAPALMASPVLDSWRYGYRKTSCLEGIVEGHPSLRDGHVISTSEIWAHFHEEDEHFVRTLSRWYRLGARGSTAGASDDGLQFPGGRRG